VRNFFFSFLAKHLQGIYLFPIFVSNKRDIDMPTLFYYLGLRFFFYSNDHEPVHVHVSNGDGEARYMVDPIVMIDNHGLKPRDLRIAEAAIEENMEIIIERWNEYFAKKK
jgi:hypothetical protein